MRIIREIIKWIFGVMEEKLSKISPLQYSIIPLLDTSILPKGSTYTSRFSNRLKFI